MSKAEREVVWRPMEPLERAAVDALSGCRFGPGTPVKRFARSMSGQLYDYQGNTVAWPKITDRQNAALWSYCWHFRKQIKDHAVNSEAAKRHMTGHNWGPSDGLIKYPFCRNCLVIRRRDDMNGPCKGQAKLRPMEPKLVEAV